MKKISIIILAGGNGERFGASMPKQFMSLNGKAVIQHSIDILEPYANELIIVSNREYGDYKVVEGGKTRQESVFNGLKACSDETDYVIIHDAVRPLVSTKSVERIIEALNEGYKSVDTAIPVTDGLLWKGAPINKKDYSLSQTPEGFDYKLLLEAHETAHANNLVYQDDVTLMHFIQLINPYIVDGVQVNSKITHAEDLSNYEGILKFRTPCIETVPNLKDKKILIFGGTRGIGQSCYLHSVDSSKFVHTVGKEYLDLSASNIDEKLRDLFNFDDYDSIIFSAGEYKDIDKIMQVNFNACLKLLNVLESLNWRGNIVFLSSTASTYGRKGFAVYSASKSALNALIEAEHDRLAEKGIIVNAIAPAKVDTDLQTYFNADCPKEKMMTPKYVARRVLRYLDTDVHGHIIFLRKGFDK